MKTNLAHVDVSTQSDTLPSSSATLNQLNFQQLIDNQIIQIFQFHSTIFVCGTNRCGLCDGVRKDFSKTKLH